MSHVEPIHILYIRNNVPSTHVLQAKLEQAGYSIDVAPDSQVGLALCQTKSYDLIIVDQLLSGAQGIEAIRLLVTTVTHTTPTIFVASSEQEQIAVEAMKLGVSDFIIKDAQGGYLELIIIVIEQVLQQRQLAAKKRRNMLQVERAKQEWETTVDSLGQLVCLLDQDGRVVRANRTIEQWGLAQVIEVQGQYFDDLLPVGTQWASAWQDVVQGGIAEFELEALDSGRYLNIQVHPISTQTKRRERLVDSFAAVVAEDITDRKFLEMKLQENVNELASRNEELDAFAQTVAHDLQNPLGLIVGFADALSQYQHTMSPEEADIYLHKILDAGKKMNSIIDALLLFANVRQREVQLKPLNMAQIINQVREQLDLLIEEYEAEIVIPEKWPLVLGYGPWVEEVWANYLSNGIKYGGQPPRLILGSSLEPNGMVRFWVQDNGDGLTREEQSQLFQPFTRLHQERAAGHGLGLSIVYRIITKLGGQVNVQSAGQPGQGTMFSFTLKRASMVDNLL